MGYNFVSADRDQRFLLPPDMREWLAADHLVWCVLDAVEQVDLDRFRRAYRTDGHGRAAFDPALMVALLLYAYSTGERSSRRIERRCVEDVAFRVIAGGHLPDHATIARFRARHEDALKGLFVQVLTVLAAAGLVRLNLLALDGTKIAADASWSANKTLPQIEQILAEATAVDAAEDAQFGAARGDELPPGMADRAQRVARLRAARDRLAADEAGRQAAQEQKLAAWQARRATGVRHPGRKPGLVPPPSSSLTGNGKARRVNTTDPDCRTMKTKHTLLAGYNAQAVVTADQIVVGAVLTQAPVDRGLLHTVLDTCRGQLSDAGIATAISTVAADAGYAREVDFLRGETDKLRLLIPLAKDVHRITDADPAADGVAGKDLPATGRAQRRMRHWKGKRDYAQRGRTIEPVFGQIKTRQGFTRFSRRGLPACDSEWHLAVTAHNLLKLHQSRQQT